MFISSDWKATENEYQLKTKTNEIQQKSNWKPTENENQLKSNRNQIENQQKSIWKIIENNCAGNVPGTILRDSELFLAGLGWQK